MADGDDESGRKGMVGRELDRRQPRSATGQDTNA